jgi:ABC-type multidrug transport system fused ATPase/permease subunit
VLQSLCSSLLFSGPCLSPLIRALHFTALHSPSLPLAVLPSHSPCCFVSTMAGAAAAAASSPDAPPVPVPAPVTVQINHLKFTYPGIDGAPPPGAKPLIQDFNLTLRAGHRCLLVGANGAGSSLFVSLSHSINYASLSILRR